MTLSTQAGRPVPYSDLGDPLNPARSKLESMERPISLAGACAALTEFWSPRVLARVNDQYVKVARVQGEFPWHTHDAEDELFLVLRGALTIGRAAVDGGPVTLYPGEVFVVPKGLRHNTSAVEETWIALVETVTTLHSGSERTGLTRSLDEQLRSLEMPGPVK